MTGKSEPDLKKTIAEFMERLKEATRENSAPEPAQINANYFFQLVYELGRHMNLSSNFKALFTEQDRQNFKEIFPKAFVSLVAYIHSLVCNMDDNQLTTAKIWLSNLAFFKNEIFNFYKEICGDVDMNLTDEFENSMSDLDEEIDRLEIDVNYWLKQKNVKDYLDQIPNLNGVPESHFWWTEENRLFSKKKFNDF